MEAGSGADPEEEEKERKVMLPSVQINFEDAEDSDEQARGQFGNFVDIPLDESHHSSVMVPMSLNETSMIVQEANF